MKPAQNDLPTNRIECEARSYERTTCHIEKGEMVALVGPPGSGKSALLKTMAGLMAEAHAAQPCVLIDDQSSHALPGNELVRRRHIGYMFRQPALINRLSVMQNVLLGALGSIPAWRGLIGRFNWEEKRRAMAALKRMDLQDLAHQRASSLSDGQKQLTTIARILMQQADVILADDPIACLDGRSARSVLKHLRSMNKDDDKTVIVGMTQMRQAQRYCDRIIGLADGHVAYDGRCEELGEPISDELHVTPSLDDEFALDNQALNLIPGVSTKSNKLFEAA
jgi:phosphonate transport system ATP-binding protein